MHILAHYIGCVSNVNLRLQSLCNAFAVLFHTKLVCYSNGRTLPHILEHWERGLSHYGRGGEEVLVCPPHLAKGRLLCCHELQGGAKDRVLIVGSQLPHYCTSGVETGLCPWNTRLNGTLLLLEIWGWKSGFHPEAQPRKVPLSSCRMVGEDSQERYNPVTGSGVENQFSQASAAASTGGGRGGQCGLAIVHLETCTKGVSIWLSCPFPRTLPRKSRFLVLFFVSAVYDLWNVSSAQAGIHRV